MRLRHPAGLGAASVAIFYSRGLQLPACPVDYDNKPQIPRYRIADTSRELRKKYYDQALY
jgi:hypothetical protein